VAVALALGAALYVTLGGERNATDAEFCATTEARAAALDPLVKGEVAAFQVAREPQKLSDLAFEGAAAEPTTLAAFEGKVALVNLWATWCAPCRQEMPALDRLQAALGGEDFVVVPVSIDTSERDRPAEFLESIGVKNLPLYTDRSTEIFEQLRERGLALGLPVTLLLDRNGCHLGLMNGPAEWDSADGRRLIEAALAAPPTT
jgi:thiol-disulfide isomerase/thioredoxin